MVCHKRSICLVYLNQLVLVNCSFVVVMVTGQYYSEDQLLNIHSFSALKRWLLSEEFTSDSSTQVANFVVKYCIRVMEQCERSEFACIQMYICISCSLFIALHTVIVGLWIKSPLLFSFQSHRTSMMQPW